MTGCLVTRPVMNRDQPSRTYKKNKNMCADKNKNIVLIGFMGVGKGRTARVLAEKTGMYALDCDDLIESFSNNKIKRIFRDEGEQAFRSLERKTAVWLEKNVTGSIISTGGGFINVPNIRDIGTIVYLHSDFDSIIKGIENHPNAEKKIRKRPLLQDLEAARKLFESRLPIYRDLAEIEIYVAERSLNRVAEEIVERLAR